MASKLYPDAYAERSEVVRAGFVNAPPAAYGAIGQPQTQPQSPMIVLPYQSQPSLYPAPDSSLYPAQMQQQNRIPVYAPVMRSVCVLLAPLYFRTYWLILYFILISFPWALFLFSFVSGTLAGSFGAIAACGVGIPLVALFAYSWRALAHLDVWLTKTFCPPADLTETVIMRHITVNRNPGFGSWLKANLLHPLTWSSVLYSLFWRPLWSTFTFATVLTLLSVSLAMLAKPFLGAVDLDPFENCKTCQWFLQDHSAYVVMIIVAVVLLYVLCALVHGLASVERRMSWWALGQRTISAQDYASYTVVPVTLNGAPNTTDSMTSVAKIVDPADKYQSATMARYALPATPVLPYARRRSNCARSLCFCCCCCTFLAIFLCGAAAGLLAARCATAARSEQESEYRLNTTAPGVSSLLVDASGIAWGAAIAVEGVGNATDQIIIKATLSYVQGSGVPDFLDHLTSDASADGSLYLSSAGIGLWPMVRHCPTLKLRAFLPPSFVNRPQLTFATSNSRVTVNNLPSPVLDTLSVLKLTTSNAEVRFDAAFGPTTAAVEVQTSNAAIKGTNVTAARLDATTSNGKIRFDILRTTDLSLETSNADVQLGTVVAPNSISSSIRVLTSNADIEVQAIRLANDSRSAIGLTTSNADVEATLFGFEGNFTLFAPNGDADLENLQWRVVQYTTNTKSEKTGYVRTQHGLNTISLRTSNADAELTLYA